LALFGLLLSLCFSFGLREWLRPQDDAPVPVDVEYVRSENYFGSAFRAQMRQWIETSRPVEDAGAGGGALLEKPPSGSGRIRVLPGGCVPGAGEYNDLIYCQGDLSIPHDSVFHQEIYAIGNLRSDAHAKFQSLAADGSIDLGKQTEVTGWVDSGLTVWLRRGTVVRKRVSAADSIELEPGVTVESLYAPLIFTSGDGSVTESAAAGQVEMPFATPAVEPGEKDFAPFLDGLAGSRLTPDTLLLFGDLELPGGKCVDGDLIVQGALRSGAGCTFRGSVKAAEIQLGPFNTVFGNLVSNGALTVGERGSLRQNVIAEHDISLRSGARVGAKDKLAAISANGSVRLERNVAVYGKIAARGAIVTI